jgi:transposase
LDENAEQLNPRTVQVFLRMYEQSKKQNEEIACYEKEINRVVKAEPRCTAVMEIEGVGPLTASAVVATPDFRTFIIHSLTEASGKAG